MKETKAVAYLGVRVADDVNGSETLIGCNVSAIVDVIGKGLKIVTCVARPSFVGKVIRPHHEASRLTSMGAFDNVFRQLEKTGFTKTG